MASVANRGDFMTHRFVIELPDDVLETFQKVADSSNRPVEAVITETLLVHQPLPDDIDSRLAALAICSDEQLWAVVGRQLAGEQKQRLEILLDKNKTSAGLNTAERAELEAFLELIDEQMLMRSEALVLLKQRGYDVAHYFNPMLHQK
jgi:hypothetical protein